MLQKYLNRVDKNYKSEYTKIRCESWKTIFFNLQKIVKNLKKKKQSLKENFKTCVKKNKRNGALKQLDITIQDIGMLLITCH